MILLLQMLLWGHTQARRFKRGDWCLLVFGAKTPGRGVEGRALRAACKFRHSRDLEGIWGRWQGAGRLTQSGAAGEGTAAQHACMEGIERHSCCVAVSGAMGEPRRLEDRVALRGRGGGAVALLLLDGSKDRARLQGKEGAVIW